MARENISSDRSTEEFLTAHRRQISPKMQDLMRSYIEGFHAADVSLMSERAFAKAEKEKDDLNEVSDFRPLCPYHDILQFLIDEAGRLGFY